ncbi:MAG TPA: peptidylprolyl isomerase [Candidatus Rifleibacterium sp.]|nr:peptidylprolyl isomerase [Candidatus Rifleibacterium sp.]
MFEKITVIDNHEMLLVSQRAVFMFIGFLLLMTFALMSFFLWADFDSILGRKHLAMKVGQTSISLEELKKIQNVSGIRAKQLSEAAFATDFFETLLLAEGARKNGLDRKPEFQQKISDFAAAGRNDSDDDAVARAAFLIEELAEAERQHLFSQTAAAAGETEKVEQPGTVTPRVRLHLKTILLAEAASASEILAQHASGTSFAELNASHSISLYKGVGGDIGWKSESDLPEGVFAKLLGLAPGVLTEGFSDQAGTHLYLVSARPEEDPAVATRSLREQKLRESRKSRLMRHLIELKNSIDYWINPILQIKCQVTPGQRTADSAENR